MENFNEKKYTAHIEAFDVLDNPVALETWYKPAFASELETLIDYIESGCCTWSGKNIPLAQRDFDGFVRMVCDKIAEEMIDYEKYRQEFFADLTKYMNQMFDHANSTTKKLSKADKEMCLNSAKGLENYLPQISAILDNKEYSGSKEDKIKHIGSGLFLIHQQYFEIVRIEAIDFVEQ